MFRSLNPDLLRSFLIITETQSFSETAERVGRSQAAVSQQIKRLETILGQKLINRDHRDHHLTTEGEILYDYARQILALNDEAYLRLSQSDIDGILHIGAPEVLTATRLSKILSNFRQSHPHIVLNVNCLLSHELQHEFSNGSYDVVLYLRELENTHQKSENQYYREKLSWIKGKSETIDWSKPLPLILTPSPCIYRAQAIQNLEKHRIAWRGVMTAHSLSGRISAIKNGLGVSLLPTDMVDNDLEIISTKDTPLPDVNDLEMVYETKQSKTARQNALAQQFVETLLNHGV